MKGYNYESNGPDVKVRGTAQQVVEKYLALGRDAFSAGDRIAAEGYFQYAEHYYRVMVSEGGGHNGYPRGPGGGRIQPATGGHEMPYTDDERDGEADGSSPSPSPEEGEAAKDAGGSEAEPASL